MLVVKAQASDMEDGSKISANKCDLKHLNWTENGPYFATCIRAISFAPNSVFSLKYTLISRETATPFARDGDSRNASRTPVFDMHCQNG